MLSTEENTDNYFNNLLNDIDFSVADKCKANLLRFHRPFISKRKLFIWFLAWANTLEEETIMNSYSIIL